MVLKALMSFTWGPFAMTLWEHIRVVFSLILVPPICCQLSFHTAVHVQIEKTNLCLYAVAMNILMAVAPKNWIF